MSTVQQTVDTKTGEVLGYRNLDGNKDFVMTFRKAYEALRALGLKDAKARVLFDFFLEHMDRENALIVSRQTIAEFLGWSVPTVDRKLKVLRDEKCLDILKSGTSNIYYINADIAWSTYSNKREYAKFRANVFIGKTEQEPDVKSSRQKELSIK